MTHQKDIFDRIMELPGLRIFNNFYTKYKSLLLYLFFGGLTTVISIASFILFDQLGLHELLSNILSWILAVLFAYVTNRVWVFGSKAKGKEIGEEMLSFFSGRLLTLGLEEAMLLFFVTLLSFNGTLIKCLGQVVVLILNYLISKLLVFRTKGKRNAKKI